jgi:hypothetical protein
MIQDTGYKIQDIIKVQGRRKIFYIFLTILLTPLWMWISWLLWPTKDLNILILDKTVLTKAGNEHRSFNWILTNQKFAKPNGRLYKIEEDYFGFFPKENEKYEIRGLEGLSEEQIDTLSQKYDMVYCTDTYGIYYNEWYAHANLTEHSRIIYGGCGRNDLLFLEKMKEQNKLIITEFNFIATPTRYSVRKKAEKLFNIKWSGWTGRYFDSLDTLTNPELPRWAIRGYKKLHNNEWPFKNSGIIFVHESEIIVVLENITHLNFEVPVIITTNERNRKRFNIPEKILYPFWFDITYTDTDSNTIISNYILETNALGDSILKHYRIPKKFPASIEHNGKYKFYYFGGDFSDNPIRNFYARFKGIRLLKTFLYNPYDLISREPFFWEYYIPMVTKIVSDYYRSL